MLKYRVVCSVVMTLILVGFFYVDNQLDQHPAGTAMQTVLMGRSHPPPGLACFVILLMVILLASREISHILQAKGFPTKFWTVALYSTGGLCTAYFFSGKEGPDQGVIWLATAMAFGFMFSLISHCWRGQTQGSVTAAGGAMFAWMYLGVLPSFMLLIRQDHNTWTLTAMIFIPKSCDIGAYFIGRAFGKHKMIPWLSPGKTWEGLAGGVVASSAFTLGLVALSNHYQLAGQWVTADGQRVFETHIYSLGFAAVAGAVLGLFGQVGDLTASLLKRDAGLKDSGTAIPGFGGMLDVLDSPLVATPVGYWLLMIVG